MRVRLIAVAALLGLAPLGVPADAASTVHVSGRVIDASGKGVAGARVEFALRPDPMLYNQQYCPVRPWEIQCRVHRVTGTTRADGRYSLPVKLSSYLASEKKHDLVVTDRSGAQTAVQFYFVRKPMTVKDMPIWRGRASIDPDGPLHRTLHVDALAPFYGTLYMQGALVHLMQGSAPAWQFTTVKDDRRVDGRIVETGITGIKAYQVAIRERQYLTYSSPVYKVPSAVRPLSRGAACATYGPDDKLLPLAGCKYTDGRLTTPISAKYQQAGYKSCNSASQCANPRHVLLDLKTVQPVGAFVARGCVPGELEVSAEGTAFAPWPTATLGDGAYVGPPVLARYVRVDLAKCAFKATELSVFAPL
ncbi:MAG TPA: carboxypeptidase-like regulatory domain-containing protein [Frankiaceae bacterium]|nr:carboxypeptidase-like regulatory domain-containing protein [Frankiaceae bacterium]